MTTTPEETRMPIDPNHRALLRAVDGLTTQVRRIADTLETPVDTTDDDGAQTTSDDTPAWKLCTCGDTPVTARHPETCPLSREPYASELAEIHGTPRSLREIERWAPVCGTSKHLAHATGTCGEAEGFTDDVLNWVARMAVPDWQHVTETMRENDRLRTELAHIRRALDPDDETYIQETVDNQLALTATISRVRTALDDRPALCTDSVYERGWNDAAEMVRHALDGAPK